MPLPPLPNNLETGLRQFARGAQLSGQQLLAVIRAAILADESGEPDEDEDVIEADASILPPDDGLDLHPPTTELERMTPQRARRLARVRNMSGYKRVTTPAQRRHLRRRSA